MDQIGEKVVYGIHGVCTIIELETKIIDRQKVRYYVLEPLEQPGARYYIPTGESKSSIVQAYSPLLRFTMSEILVLSLATADVNCPRLLGIFLCRIKRRAALVHLPMSQFGKFTELTMLPFSN